ncbi:hypothetical protein KGO5_02466 [Sinorhizobium sp. KGO-5]|uniref:DUF1614 domain-containing protein n=1 Tax=Sinorhizobium sp. KGO-5 TaxID=1470810 RepID=UPI0029490F50|nr:hypothetical protein KGO5_02466 [Sinorhizobium sp. KGO-5]
MRLSQLHYLPLPAPLFSVLALSFLVLVALIQLGVLQYAYTRLGISAHAALLLLLGSLLGSYLNLPLAELPGQEVLSGRVVDYFGMRYVVPVVVDWPGTIIAVNVGGALIPILMSIYLLSKNGLWGRGLLATAFVAGVCHWLATPVPGLGIALPVFVPAISTGLVALLLSRQYAAPLAYVGGSLGSLAGADLLNLGNLQGLGAPVASIGGAGTFDGIFVTAILAVLIASLSRGLRGSQTNRLSSAATMPEAPAHGPSEAGRGHP